MYSSDEALVLHNVAISEKEVGHRNNHLKQLDQGAEGLSGEELCQLNHYKEGEW